MLNIIFSVQILELRPPSQLTVYDTCHVKLLNKYYDKSLRGLLGSGTKLFRFCLWHLNIFSRVLSVKSQVYLQMHILSRYTDCSIFVPYFVFRIFIQTPSIIFSDHFFQSSISYFVISILFDKALMLIAPSESLSFPRFPWTVDTKKTVICLAVCTREAGIRVVH